MTRLPVKIARERIHIALFQRRLRIRVGVLFPGEAAMKDAVAAQGDPAAPADINWFLCLYYLRCAASRCTAFSFTPQVFLALDIDSSFPIYHRCF